MRNFSVVVGTWVVGGDEAVGILAEELAGMPAFEVVPVTMEEDAPDDIPGSSLAPRVSYVRGPGAIAAPVTSTSLSDIYDDDDIS